MFNQIVLTENIFPSSPDATCDENPIQSDLVSVQNMGEFIGNSLIFSNLECFAFSLMYLNS